MQIKRLQIQNFKIFENFTISFSGKDLIVFDGPNGFGKTSLYDAIELLITGKLRRYQKMVEINIDHREVTKGNPFLNDKGQAGDLFVKAEIEINGKIICLIRIGDREALKSDSQMGQFHFYLYTLPNFDSLDFLLVDDEFTFLTGIFGDDYRQNFQYLNYIEQEENTYLLKNKDKDRKEAIGHLFNTSEFEYRIKQLDETSKKIGTLCGAQAERALKKQKAYLDEEKNKFKGIRDEVPYKKIISWKDIPWDAEIFSPSNSQYLKWLGGEGELARIAAFIEHADLYKKNSENRKLDLLIGNEFLLTQLLKFWNFIERSEEFRSRLSLQNSIKALLQTYEKGLEDAISKGRLTLTSQLRDLLESEVDVEEYANALEKILVLQKNANSLGRLLISIKDSRRILIEHFSKLPSGSHQDNDCPLCGYSWDTPEELKGKFIEQENYIQSLILTSGNDLNISLENFRENFILPIGKFLNEYISAKSVDELFIEKLSDAKDNRIKLASLHKNFVDANIDLSPFLNDQPLESKKIELDGLIKQIDNRKYSINIDALGADFDEIFFKIFDENFDLVTLINKEVLAEKYKYINWQFSLSQSAYVSDLQKQYDAQFKKYTDATAIKSKINLLKKIYEQSLNEHQKKVINDIEILFHIYSGRISLDCQGGLGLFISSEKNGIRFLENASKSHDAIFTMSSGQLSSLVISFTLALNKRYAKNNLLFIDDPVQTLDELNVAGLIDLLRNEFSDRQIFISTHEDMMSAYIRYKFQRSGLETERINFKAIQLLNTEKVVPNIAN